LHSSQYIIKDDEVKEDEMGRLCIRHGEMINAYRRLVGKPERKGPL
jgi:predicted RNA-binding protein YlqC (UPF0109 family)